MSREETDQRYSMEETPVGSTDFNANAPTNGEQENKQKLQEQPGVNQTLENNPCATTTCERCKRVVRPLKDTLPDCKTHLLASLCFCIGLPFCCFIPYCCNCCGKLVNRCPKCGAFIRTVG